MFTKYSILILYFICQYYSIDISIHHFGFFFPVSPQCILGFHNPQRIHHDAALEFDHSTRLMPKMLLGFEYFRQTLFQEKEKLKNGVFVCSSVHHSIVMI